MAVEASEPSRQVTFTGAGFLHGARAAQALCAGVFVYGVAFGLVAQQVGLSLIEAGLMSAVVYSGSAQLAAASALGGRGAGGAVAVSAIAATILVMNARYILYGAALRPWLGKLPAFPAYATLFFLGDGNWLLSMKEHAAGGRDAAYVLGSGLAMFVAWLAGTILGQTAGLIVPDPSRLGLDFLLVAFAAAMGVGMFKGKGDLAALAAAAATAIVVNLVASTGWAIVAAGIAGAITAAIRFAPPDGA
ncbi:AzlC family ABC transporter permease [Phreatobacter stygius]|uniref:ABC transporter permease n=1 Tax=Phreatobacter stygius TaxID=1940610 RepID=A0A4D7B8J2_9HYPH|nr:AzlC family ABC transporter permease [Phreatobacter stygius]QCI64347.1 ABC transporter permease [Phreatobacter stygius]